MHYVIECRCMSHQSSSSLVKKLISVQALEFCILISVVEACGALKVGRHIKSKTFIVRPLTTKH